MISCEQLVHSAGPFLSHVPEASVSDLRKVEIGGNLDRARSLRSPLCCISVRTDHGEASGDVELVNYSDTLNHTRLLQAVTALALRVLRSGCRTLTVSVNVVDALEGGQQAPWKSLLLKRFRGALVYEQWNIAAGTADHALSALRASIGALPWMPHPAPLTFDADPFVVDLDGRAWLLYEHIDQRNRGEIWCRELLSGGVGTARPLLQLPTHLSYPYVFDHAGRTYMLPENSASGQTIAYELTGPELGIGRQHVLFDNLGVVDPTLVEVDGRWWLFGGIAGLADNAALFAWYAESPFGPYTPHAMNPVKVDARSGRPGGTMWFSQGTLMRPAQDCSVRYGGSLKIMSVGKLTTEEFEEVLLEEIHSPNPAYPAGIHTLARHRDLMAIDGLRDVLSPAMLYSVIRR